MRAESKKLLKQRDYVFMKMNALERWQIEINKSIIRREIQESHQAFKMLKKSASVEHILGSNVPLQKKLIKPIVIINLFYAKMLQSEAVERIGSSQTVYFLYLSNQQGVFLWNFQTCFFDTFMQK